MKNRIKNVFIGLINKVSQTYVTMTRQPFEVTSQWLKRLQEKHFDPEVEAKYNKNLYVDADYSEDVYNLILLNDGLCETVYQQIKIVLNHGEALLNRYNVRKVGLSAAVDKEELKNLIELIETAVTNMPVVLKSLVSLQTLIKNRDFEKIVVFGLPENLDKSWLKRQKIKSLKEVLSQAGEDFNETERLTALYSFQSELDLFVKKSIELQRNTKLLKSQAILMHGGAGMGKSAFAMALTKSLVDSENPVLFLKGTAFRGSPDDFDNLLLRALEVPMGYSLNEILSLLNDYGKSNDKRLTFIFDALNETTFQNQGFSPIWKNHLDRFLSELKNFPYLFFVATLRTSYIQRIWSGSIPYTSRQMSGFDGPNLKDAVEKYFDYYKIDKTNLKEEDIHFFRTPLMLQLYCRMLNPSRDELVQPLTRLEGFVQVFDQYLDKLSAEVKKELGLISKEVVYSSINRCSQHMMDNLEIFLPIVDYYNLMEGRPVTRIDGTIGKSVLEGHLIFLPDNLQNKDVVVHTQQEVGGYLLAKALRDMFGSYEAVVQSEFFQTHLIGTDNLHNLKDDILKFLSINSERDEFVINNNLDNEVIRQIAINKLQREHSAEPNSDLREKLFKDVSVQSIRPILDASKAYLLVPHSPLRIECLIPELLKLNALDFDMAWTYFVHHNGGYLQRELERIDENLISGDLNLSLCLDFLALMLETTIRELRDKATLILIRFGEIHPDLIYDKLLAFLSTDRIYVFERLSMVLYGVCLRRQNNSEFVSNNLRYYAENLFVLQFQGAAGNAKYNYNLIDSFKHIIDLAIHKNEFELEPEQSLRLSKYQFDHPETWNEPTEKDFEQVYDIVNDSYRSGDRPDPLKMDFVIYTIPRLIKRDDRDNHELTAHVFKRIKELGYLTLEVSDRLDDDPEVDFFYGWQPEWFSTKVDRLGKKYSWMAYFDYAGYLLKKGELDVWAPEDTSVTSHYERLSDVEIEVSILKPSAKQALSLIDTNLLSHRNENPDWTILPKYDLLLQKTIHVEEGHDFVMLSGKIEENQNDQFKVRSFVDVEAFLVNKADLAGKQEVITNREVEWHDGIRWNHYLSRTYFGELYWSDNIPDVKPNYEWLSTSESALTSRRLTIRDVAPGKKYEGLETGMEIEEEEELKLRVELEPATVEYLWESGSDVFPTLTRQIPSENIGKLLDLRADCENFRLIDQELNVATLHYNYKAKGESQDFMFLRKDLLKKYLDEKGLVLMYQVKQHTYDNLAGDGSGDFRGMQYFFPALS